MGIGISRPCSAAQGERLQLRVFRHFDDAWPVFLGGDAQHFNDFDHLVTLKGHRLLAVYLCFFALEDGTGGQELSEDAAYGPEVDGGGVVFGPQKEVRGAVPDRYDDFVAGEEGRERFVE